MEDVRVSHPAAMRSQSGRACGLRPPHGRSVTHRRWRSPPWPTRSRLKEVGVKEQRTSAAKPPPCAAVPARLPRATFTDTCAPSSAQENCVSGRSRTGWALVLSALPRALPGLARHWMRPSAT